MIGVGSALVSLLLIFVCYGLGRRKVICAVQHNLFIEADSEKLKPMTSRQFVGKWKGVKFQ